MRKLLMGAAVAVVATIATTAGVGAGPLPAFDYTPTSGPPGTVISASGDCDVFLPTGTQGGVATPQGLSGTVTLELSSGGSTLDSVTDDMDSDGSWALEVTVPPGTAAGVYDLDASCSFGFLEEQGGPTPAADAPAGNGSVFEYATQPFTVTAQPTSTTAEPTTTTTAAGQTTTTVRPAVAAQAVRTAPAFTG